MTTSRHLRTIHDLAAADVTAIIEHAFLYKDEFDRGIAHPQILTGKNVVLLFEKPSLRTRIAFDIAVHALGGHPIFQSSKEVFTRADGTQREAITDITHVLERTCDAIVARVHAHDTITKMANASSVPVINALCDGHHPTQALADLMTMLWHKPQQKDLRVTFVGDGNNVATSLLQICTLMGIHCTHAGPEGYQIPREEWQIAQDFAKKSGAELLYTTDPVAGVRGADVVYTDTFVSMGDEGETNQRLKDFAHYQVNAALMAHAKPDAIFLHDLPAHRGEEVTDEVIDSAQSKVFDLAECRMHIAKALLTFFLS